MGFASGGLGGESALVLALGAQQASLASNTCQTSVTPIDTSHVTIKQWDAAQKTNVAAIVEQVKVDVPRSDHLRASIVALATAMQESDLTNINYGDRDSIGLFQQRSGWGPAAERMDPHKATHLFLTGGHAGQRGLLDIPGWQGMSITQAAQAVQASAFPTAYAQWEGPATVLAVALIGASQASGPVVPDPCGAGVGGTPPAASANVETMLRYAKSLLGTPYVYGGTTYPPGVDCSGLLVYSWAKAGHPLAVRTSEQMWRVSTQLQPGQEQRGDLVFSEFVGGTDPGHVMIVWDPAAGTVIEAPHTGDVVKIIHYGSLPGIRFGRLRAAAWSGAR